MISFLPDSTNDCFKILLANKLLGYYIWHVPTFLLKDLAASSKLSCIFQILRVEQTARAAMT
jgi:hypothetical protein